MRRRIVALLAVAVTTACSGLDREDDNDRNTARATVAWPLDGNGVPSAGRARLEFDGKFTLTKSAVAFDGATGFARTAGSGPVDTTRSFSVAAWVALAAPAPFPTAMSQLGDVAAAFYLQVVDGAWAFTMKTADKSRADVTVRALSTERATVDADRWVHVAGTYDRPAREIRLYVDGARRATAEFTARWRALGPFVIGRAQGAAAKEAYWPGAIDDVRIYATALNDAQVMALHRTTKPKSSPPSIPAAPPGFHCPHGAGECLGPLEAGTYTTKVFSPPITYTVPEGWTNAEDLLGNFVLVPTGETAGIGIFRDVRAPLGCEEVVDESVPKSAAALTRWLRANPELETTSPRPITVGGLRGVRLDLKLSRSAQLCPHFAVNFIIGVGDPSHLTHGLTAGASARLYVLAYRGGNIVIEINDEGDPSSTLRRRSEPVIESLRFAATG